MPDGHERQTDTLRVDCCNDIVARLQLGIYVHKLEHVADRWTLRCICANPASESLSGVKVSEIVGRMVDDVLPELRAQGVIDAAVEVAQSGVPIELDDLAYGSGPPDETDWSCSVFPLPDGHVGMTFQNMTRRRRAEAQTRCLMDRLAHAGRADTMGEMASGLAHELNQPLAAIVAYVDACLELINSGRMDDNRLAEVLQAVAGQAERAGQIIHRLRQMVKRRQPVRSPIDVNNAVREIAELMELESRRCGATLQLHLAEDAPQVAADYLQIQQVLLHLVRNALDALAFVPEERRQVTIATGRTPGGELEVSICDRGEGTRNAPEDRLFEPFFTTRPEGLGLGLSIARTIVQAHSGRIRLESNSQGGATAHFTLPPSGETASGETASGETTSVEQTGVEQTGVEQTSAEKMNDD